MKNQNISKQSGGAAIKLKSKKQEIIKIILLCIIGIFVVRQLFLFVDSVGNGIFVDWFMNNYMYETDAVYGGKNVIIREPAWPGIKRLVYGAMCVNIVFWIVGTYGVSRFCIRRSVKNTITSISDGIRDYMQQGGSLKECFEEEYFEISVQMSEVKSNEQRHEQLLREETKRKNDLIAYLAHDLKTPLTSVIGYLSLLDEAPDMPDEQKAKYIRIALEKADRLEMLINEFFDITRYNLQQMELEKEVIDLYYMLVQMTDEFYPILQAHGNTAVLRVPEDKIIYGDPAKLARVFNNILKNAVAYSYRGTAIEIWTENTDTQIQIYFSNQGKNIPERKLESIFEKFFRADESRAANTGGAGLGLAIAREIVTLHGGTITAKSKNERTTFCVSLPLEHS